jgi:perosamine synthetase
MSESQTTPFFRPSISTAEIDEVVDCLKSGWLTSGPRVNQFETNFAAAVGAEHAVAVNSCTAALHLAVDSLGLGPKQAVLIPTMTFAATAEIVHYQRAVPILVDCDPITGNMDVDDATHKLRLLREGWLPERIAPDLDVVGIIPVHVGGLMMDVTALQDFAREHNLWIVEDAAHAFPAAWRPSEAAKWQRCGEGTADATCYSFYANKTITTGEGGMLVTNDPRLAEQSRLMSLHGLSLDAWERYRDAENSSWDYRIVHPGYKYNLTDLAAAIGIHQLARAESMRAEREALALRYIEALAHVEEIELSGPVEDRVHAWHLFPIRLQLERLSADRNTFIQELKSRGVGCSVHWRPLHLHPLYQQQFGWTADLLPAATVEWQRRISLPLFPGMTAAEQNHVIETVTQICRRFSTVTKVAVRG